MAFSFALVLLAAASFYAILFGCFAYGFRKVRDRQPPTRPDEASLPSVSVIIAARDEEQNIGPCLERVLACPYPADRLEVIVVDDFSSDRTGEAVGRIQQKHGGSVVPRLVRMADLMGSPTGRKHDAIAAGIAHSTGDIILTTDADCRVAPTWIGAMMASFDEETGFVAGPVRYRPGETLFGHLQALEFMALVATGAGGIGLGRPNMCNSANVAYRREVFVRYGQETNSPGSDEVMAQQLAAESSWQVRFCATPAALVETDPLLDWQAFWAQRRRWAGTGPRYPRPGLVLVIVAVYLFYVLLLAGMALLWFVPGLWPAVVLALGMKAVAEAILLYPACVLFGQRWLFRYFLPEQLLQIVYVVTVGLAAAMGDTQWKGRKAFG